MFSALLIIIQASNIQYLYESNLRSAVGVVESLFEIVEEFGRGNTYEAGKLKNCSYFL